MSIQFEGKCLFSILFFLLLASAVKALFDLNASGKINRARAIKNINFSSVFFSYVYVCWINEVNYNIIFSQRVWPNL